MSKLLGEDRWRVPQRQKNWNLYYLRCFVSLYKSGMSLAWLRSEKTNDEDVYASEAILTF